MGRILHVVLLVTYYTFTPHMERYNNITSYVYVITYYTYVGPFRNKMTANVSLRETSTIIHIRMFEVTPC
jgi:hypothetical protein